MFVGKWRRKQKGSSAFLGQGAEWATWKSSDQWWCGNCFEGLQAAVVAVACQLLAATVTPSSPTSAYRLRFPVACSEWCRGAAFSTLSNGIYIFILHPLTSHLRDNIPHRTQEQINFLKKSLYEVWVNSFSLPLSSWKRFQVRGSQLQMPRQKGRCLNLIWYFISNSLKRLQLTKGQVIFSRRKLKKKKLYREKDAF